MTAIPPPTDTVVTRIYSALENRAESLRGHLGASIIGHHCDRWLWLSFRWAIVQKFDGRIRRLFRRGHLEEPQILADLRMIGVDVSEFEPGTSKQYGFKDGHFAGSMDGLITGGVPEAPTERHILEIKTHGRKSYDDLVKQGVEKSKPMHYAQMQIYMANHNVYWALYVAVCKDSDHLYAERIEFVREVADKYQKRAQWLIAADRMPEPCSTDPTWYQCKMCAAHEFCHSKVPTKEVNCRTCAHSTAVRDGRWHCGRWDQVIPQLEHQRDGCDSHVIHPDLVPWPMTPGSDGNYVEYTIDGVQVRNGEGGYKSREIIANPSACTGQHSNINMVKALWPESEIQG